MFDSYFDLSADSFSSRNDVLGALMCPGFASDERLFDLASTEFSEDSADFDNDGE